MSEKIYAWLLRLYPAYFREVYGDDALQLFRDRARDEKGLLPRLRLWLDLLGDLAISVPREYFAVRPAFLGAAHPSLGGIPSFFVLGDETPGLGALLFGAVMTSMALATFWILLNTGGIPGLRTRAAGSLPSAFGSAQAQVTPPNPTEAETAMNRAIAVVGNLDATERQRVIEGVSANLKQHYVDRDVAKQMADSLMAHQKNGDYDPVTDGAAFAGLLTEQVRYLSKDRHLDVVYSEAPLPEHAPELTAEDQARYRKAMDEENCTFEKVEMQPHRIGYVKLNSFPEVAVCEATAREVMKQLNGARAILFDLRDNRGGEPDMVMLMAAYLFDHPEYMYSPRENTTERSWTQSPVAGSKLADKPVFVLTSHATASGAEHFSYDLKMLKRATLVGETTSGAAHSGVFHRIDEHFGMGISETKPINPFSKNDWAVVGVEPDVKVKAADALKTAQELALRKIGKK